MASVKIINTNASRFMDQISQPYMKRVRSYCKNASHVNILENIRVPPTSYLSSLDIESLYTKITFDIAIDVLLKIFADQPRLVLYLDLVKFVLKIFSIQRENLPPNLWYRYGKNHGTRSCLHRSCLL